MPSEPDETNPLLEDEASALRRRVAELERELAAARSPGQGGQRARPTSSLPEALRITSAEQAALLDALPVMVFFKDRDHRYILANRAYADHHRLPLDQIIGKKDEEIFVPETARTYRESDEAIMAAGAPVRNVELRWELADGTCGWTVENDVPYRDESGRVVGMVGVVMDVTAQKQAVESLRRTEAELRSAQERLIETVSALATPILPIEEDILVLPLVGYIDSTRSDHIMEALLAGVARHGARFVILDLTGVPVVDSAVAAHLLRAARAVALLGAQCVLCGISPAIAQSMVDIGADLRELVLQRDLRAAVRYALARRAGAAPPSKGAAGRAR
ncbi:MAG: PAS domain-containing protein [Polyangiaceae bacterium]|nr:PAS domain-containing protein [Polyangiaceae bacterium]